MASMKRIEKFLLLDEREKAPSPVDTKGDEESLEKHDSAPSITLEAASFSWAADKPAFLGPLSVVLNPGHLHVCVGPVASVSRLFFIPITTLGLTHYVILGKNLVPSVYPRRVGPHRRQTD